MGLRSLIYHRLLLVQSRKEIKLYRGVTSLVNCSFVHRAKFMRQRQNLNFLPFKPLLSLHVNVDSPQVNRGAFYPVRCRI